MGYRILFIDDEWSAIEGTMRFFKLKGHTTIATPTGLEGIEIMKKQKIDFIVLDIDMPSMPGDKVIEKIKSDPELKAKNIPIAICSSILNQDKIKTGKPSHLINAIKSGEYPFFPKSILAEDLLHEIKTIIKSKNLKTGTQLYKGESLSPEEEKEYNELGWRLYKKYGSQDKWDNEDPDNIRIKKLKSKELGY